MTTVRVYDDTAKLIEKLAEKYQVAEWEFIEAILDNLDSEELDNMF